MSVCKNWNQNILKRPLKIYNGRFLQYGEISEKTPFSFNQVRGDLPGAGVLQQITWNQQKRSLFL
jgi:hypothetical protein